VRVDDVKRSEDNTVIRERPAYYCRPGVEEPGMMYNVCVATREARAALHRSMAYNATNGGSQMVTRESDAVIVPVMLGNARVGKDGT